jgi:uncharacterized protein (DUF885 family)
MNRRHFLASCSAVALSGLVPAALRAAPSGPADARLKALLDSFFAARLLDNPEQATSLGLDTGARAALRRRLDDRSRAAAARQLDQRRRERARLVAIPRDRLSPMAQIDHDVVLYQLDRTLGGARFDYGVTAGRYAPYILTHMTGAYRELPDFLTDTHPVRDAGDADAYLARLEGMATAVDQDIARQQEDAAKGVFAPDFALDTSLKLLATLRAPPAAESLLVTRFAERLRSAGLPGTRADAAARIVGAQIYPALDRQRAFVEGLRARATHDAGVWRLPDGEAFYAAAAEASTTIPMSGDEIHRIGLEQVADLGARIDAILRQQGLRDGTVGERLVALNKRPDQVFPNTDAGRAELIALLNRQIEAISAKLPQAFITLPEASVSARRVPPEIEAGAPGGYYDSAPLDGSRPASYFINLRDTFDRPIFGLKTLTYHESVPGHHLQVSLALESDAIPMIRRRTFFSGYVEGWALYAEQLADELGMYEDDPLGRVGYLQSLLFRATRLVVDSGLHAKRWSREQATDYFIATTGIARGRSQNEIDRYAIWPGQACSYKLGHTVWNRLRDAARQRQGERFDLRRFHKVLTLGPMPLSVLERVVEARTPA